MNTRAIFVRTAMLIALAAVAVAVPAQERAREGTRQGTKEQPTTRSLIQELGHRDYDKREEAERRLLERGKAARAQLEQAARDHEDAEVRWRARRILRRLEGGGKAGLRRQPRDRHPGERDRPYRRFDRVEDVDRLFEEVFRRLERELDIDIGDVRRHMERARAEARARARDLDLDAESDRQSRSMKMSITPDGVRVEVEETGRDGKVHKKTYEAEDMEAFKKLHPDVVKRFGIGGSGIRIFDGRLQDLEDFGLGRWHWPHRGLDLGPGLGQGLDQRIREQLRDYQRRHRELMEQLRRLRPPVARRFDRDTFKDTFPGQRREARDVPPPGERLGIYASDAPADVARFLGLEAGQGLEVQEVIKGSLAESLGVKAGDILFQIGDRRIFAVEDVRRALGQIAAGETVRVQVNRRGRVLRLDATKPDARKPAVGEARDKDEARDEDDEVRSKKLKQRGKLR